jgi:nucleoside phosphorylase
MTAGDTIASLLRIDATESFRIAVIITGQSTAMAETAVKDAITRCSPRAVILTGIAAGFPEARVNLGDILIPFRIVPYELAKVFEQRVDSGSAPAGQTTSTPPTVRYEHRGETLDVSHPLWFAAEALSRDPTAPWLHRIVTPRPHSSNSLPVIHVNSNSKLGSGDKLVASEFAEAREWLIRTYGAQAIGLEMEGYGAIIGCRSADTPFLLVKASQDPATAAKDDAGSKDLWRRYAASAAASFVLTLIERYRFPSETVNAGHQPSALFPSCFIPAPDRLRFLIERNFLFDFDHSGSPNYLCLLSQDYRRLFFHFWKQSERICVSGLEGCGKTFNTLLLTEQLRIEGCNSYYTSVREAGLSAASLSMFATHTTDRDLLVIDDCQDDLEKTRGLLEEASRSKDRVGKRRIVFLTRPLEPEDHVDIFGQRIPTVHFRDEFNDFPALAKLFFKKLYRLHDVPRFMKALRTETLSHELFRYRNMEFWNIYFNTMAHGADFTFHPGQFFTSVYVYLRDKDPAFLDPALGLVNLLPFFASGLAVLREWAIQRLGVTESQLAQLSSRGLIREAFLDWDNSSWENDTAVFVARTMHPTKARLGRLVAAKHGGVSRDEIADLSAYISDQLPNLYYVVSPLLISSPDLFNRLCANPQFQATLRAYLMRRHLGKHLDRLLSRLARMAAPLAQTLMDDPAVLDSLVARLNEKRPYVISKVLLLRAIHRIAPSVACAVFRRLDLGVMVAAFKAGAPGGKLAALSKLMEVLKNIYYAAPEGAEKAGVVATVRQITDECSSELIESLDQVGFGELHWLLKRLDPIRLTRGDRTSIASEFLRSIPPHHLVRWVSTKNVRVNELRFLFKVSRGLTVHADGGEVTLYPAYFREKLSPECLQRILENPRSRLYDIAITSKFGHEVLAYPLLRYAIQGGLATKVATESLFIINESIEILEGARGSGPIGTISEDERAVIIRCIIRNTSLDRNKITSTRREAKRLGRGVDIDREIERFRAAAVRYR